MRENCGFAVPSALPELACRGIADGDSGMVFAWLPRTANQIDIADRAITMTFPQRLIDDYNAFAGGRLQREQDHYRELAERGQSPQIMVIGCCDSRVSPEVIFDARPGELSVLDRATGQFRPIER